LPEKGNGATQRPEEEHVAPLEGIPAVTLLEGLIRQETFDPKEGSTIAKAHGCRLFTIAHFETIHQRR